MNLEDNGVRFRLHVEGGGQLHLSIRPQLLTVTSTVLLLRENPLVQEIGIQRRQLQLHSILQLQRLEAIRLEGFLLPFTTLAINNAFLLFAHSMEQREQSDRLQIEVENLFELRDELGDEFDAPLQHAHVTVHNSPVRKIGNLSCDR